MPTIQSDDTRTPLVAAVLSVAGLRELDVAGVYLTDEAFLYRVAGVVGELVELEDCFYLDVVRVPLADVRARGLRVVAPAAVHA
jgi:hypothetical protein